MFTVVIKSLHRLPLFKKKCIKITPFKSLHRLWFVVNTAWFDLDDPQLFCFVMVVLESLVCPEHLNCPLFRKILPIPQMINFHNLFHI